MSRLFSQRRIQWGITPDSLCFHRPVTRDQNSGFSSTLGALAFVPGALLAVVGVRGCRDGVFHRVALNDYSADDTTELISFLCFGLIFLGTFVLGYLAFLIKYRLTIGKTEISFEATWRGRVRKQWTEPLARYEGMLFHTLTEYRGKNVPPAAYAIAQLYHKDPEKCVLLKRVEIPLADTDDPSGGTFRRTWESYARALKLPALERDPQGAIIRRAPEDLDVSLEEQAQKGTVAPEWRRDVPPPDLRVEDQGDSLCVTMEIHGATMGQHILLVLVGVPLVLCIAVVPVALAGAIQGLFPRLPALLSLFLGFTVCPLIVYAFIRSVWERPKTGSQGLVRIASAARNFFFALKCDADSSAQKMTEYGESRVTIGPQTITVEKSHPKGEMSKRQAQLDSYEEIVVTEGPYAFGITLVGDQGNFWIRTPSAAAAKWLRGAIRTLAGKGKAGAQDQEVE